MRQMHEKAHAVLFDEHGVLKPPYSHNAVDPNDESTEDALSFPSASDKLSTDELLLLRGVAHFWPETTRIHGKKHDTNDSLAVPDSGQTTRPPDPASFTSVPISSPSPHSSRYQSTPNERRHEPVIVSSNLFQDVVMAQFAEGRSPLRLGAQKEHLRADTVLPVLPSPGHAYGQESSAWTRINSLPGHQSPQSAISPAGNALDPLSSTSSSDHNPSLFRSSVLSTTDLDSIMSYPVTLTPSLEPFASYAGTGQFAPTGSDAIFADNDDVDWNTLAQMAGFVSGGSGPEPEMDWEAHSPFFR